MEEKLDLLVPHNVTYVLTFFAGCSRANDATEMTTEIVEAESESSKEGSGTGKTYIYLL
jgi:hypothetical protein